MPTPSSNDTIILTGTVGSHSYGTATAASDYDFMSVVIGPPDIYFGSREWGNDGTMSSSYQSAEMGCLVEEKYYEIRKFISMCSGMNPNAIPLLWLKPELYKAITAEGQLLVDNRAIFNSKKMYNTFTGYAYSQLHKMGGIFNDKEEEEQALRAGHLKFQEWAGKEIITQRDLRNNGQDYDSGYMNALISLNTKSKEDVKRIKVGPITGRMGAARKEIRDKFGFDTKFAFHTIRLMRMCIEFLKNPEEGLKVDRRGIDHEFLYSIRVGSLKEEEVKSLADELFEEAKHVIKHTSLPDAPDYERIHNLTMDLVRMRVS